MTTTTRPELLLWLSDSRGVYIPRDFAKSFADRAGTVSGVSDEDWAILEAGPDHEYYWDTWDDVENNAVVMIDGVRYFVHQYGDCWLVPEGMEWDCEAEGFRWPKDESDE